MITRWQQADAPRGDDYDMRWQSMAAAGENIHGEADLVETLLGRYGGSAVFDAGCGTGRVAIELARRGVSVVGVDADVGMLDSARAKAPELAWIHGNLADSDDLPPGLFDLVLMAGNVMIFLEPGTEGRVIVNLAARLRPGGLLVTGFSVHPDRLSLRRYDELAAAAGLALLHRWATWERDRYSSGDYAVSVHRRPEESGP